MIEWSGDLPRKDGDVCSLIQEIGNFSFCSHLGALITRLRHILESSPLKLHRDMQTSWNLDPSNI